MVLRRTWLLHFGWVGSIAFGIAAASAEVPRLIHYQGMLKNSSGMPIDGVVGIEFKLYGHATHSAPVLFTEIHSQVSAINGLLSVFIGAATPGGVPDSALDAPEVHLGIIIDGGAELSPRPRIVSGPHAIKAQSAERLVRPSTFEGAVTVDAVGRVGVGTAAPTEQLEVAGKVKITGGSPRAGKVLTSDAEGAATWETPVGIPSGVIVMWSGIGASVPGGWLLCDGTNGTPDLRDRFVMGTGAGPGPSGGSTTHFHSIPRMEVGFGNNVADGAAGELMFNVSGGAFYINKENNGPRWDANNGSNNNNSGYLSGSPYVEFETEATTSDSAEHLPPFYKLAFIQKQ